MVSCKQPEDGALWPGTAMYVDRLESTRDTTRDTFYYPIHCLTTTLY